MNTTTVHEPEAELMSAEDAWDDAQQLHELFEQHAVEPEPVVHLNIPFSYFLSVLDTLNTSELVILHKRIEERLAV